MRYHVHKVTPMMSKCGNVIVHDYYKTLLVTHLIELLTAIKASVLGQD